MSQLNCCYCFSSFGTLCGQFVVLPFALYRKLSQKIFEPRRMATGVSFGKTIFIHSFIHNNF